MIGSSPQRSECLAPRGKQPPRDPIRDGSTINGMPDGPQFQPDSDLTDNGPDDLALDQALDGLNQWLAESQVDAAIAERRRASWMQRQDEEESTFLGALIDQVEQGHPVAIGVSAGRKHHGVLQSIGKDVIAMQSKDGRQLFVALEAIISLRGQGREPLASIALANGPRLVVGYDTMRSRLADLAGVGTIVALSDPNGDVISGEIISVGRDVVALRVADTSVTYVALGSVTEVAVVSG